MNVTPTANAASTGKPLVASELDWVAVSSPGTSAPDSVPWRKAKMIPPWGDVGA